MTGLLNPRSRRNYRRSFCILPEDSRVMYPERRHGVFSFGVAVLLFSKISFFLGEALSSQIENNLRRKKWCTPLWYKHASEGL